MINTIKAFINTCPTLFEIDVNINYLGEQSASAAVENVSAEPIIKNYTDGATLRQFLFTIAMRENYGQDAEVNRAAASKLDDISDWICEMDKRGILPVLKDGKSPISLEVIKTGWVEEKESDTAKYQLQCRLVYYQD